MALRAFRSNPSLGGFGGESGILTRGNDNVQGGSLRRKTKGTTTTIAGGDDGIPVAEKDCDAFAQIVKELVDNAIDSTRTTNHRQLKHQAKRVRVVIEPCERPTGTATFLTTDENTSRAQAASEASELLRVTVSDNGCGMADIQACVEAFRTNKVLHQSPESGATESMTAGRYGIGLTLCLLHAQRLVPNSCASITSATAEATYFTKASYVVDTEGDSVRCVRRERSSKSFPEESGTSVSVLVPGGVTAAYAWPRLAEYFARFHLIVDLCCSLEVMAPTLSRLPLFVQPPRGKRASPASLERQHSLLSLKASNETTKIQKDEDDDGDDDKSWNDAFDNDRDEKTCPPSANSLLYPKRAGVLVETAISKDQATSELARTKIADGVRSYLKLQVDVKNVAVSCQPIRLESVSKADDRPILEVVLVVHGTADDHDAIECTVDESCLSDRSAKMILVRMVNKVPLLDGAEALACGLVQGIASKQSLWNSFGLEVTNMSRDSSRKPGPSTEKIDEQFLDPANFFVPTFRVRDSEQVAPFFQQGTHRLFEEEHENVSSDDDDNDDVEQSVLSTGKRKKTRTRPLLLPAQVRLGNILIMVNIHAKPTALPLPTLSKGRLPLNDDTIDRALEVGLTMCLRSLQKSNPDLLLTAQQLKITERDTRYIPAVSAAIASVVCKSRRLDLHRSVLRTVQSWSLAKELTYNETAVSRRQVGSQSSHSSIDSAELLEVTALGPLIEKRLHLLCSEEVQKKSKRIYKRGKREVEANESDAQDTQLESENELFDADDSVQEATALTSPTVVQSKKMLSKRTREVSPVSVEGFSTAWEDSW